MAYNNNNPDDDVKIRNLPLAVRNNFQAQQAGGTSYVSERVNLFTSSTPSTQANMIRLYGKDVSSKTELYAKDEDGDVIQMTSNGKIGSTTTQALTSGVSFDDSYFYTASNFIAARAHISSAAAVTRDDGLTASTSATGKYNIIVDSGRLQTDSYQVIVTPVSSSEATLYVGVVATKPVVNPATTTTIVVYIWDATLGILANRGFDVIVIGGR